MSEINLEAIDIAYKAYMHENNFDNNIYALNQIPELYWYMGRYDLLPNISYDRFREAMLSGLTRMFVRGDF